MSTTTPAPSERLLEALVEALPDAVGVLSHGRLIYGNAAFRKLFSVEEVDAEAEHGLHRLLRQAGLSWKERAEHPRLEIDLGVPTLLDLYVRPLDFVADGICAVYLRSVVVGGSAQADRLTALGQLAAGIAHDINNPLAYVLGSLEFVEREATRAREAGGQIVLERAMLGALVNAREGALRVRNIVRDLMTFARPIAESKQLVDVESVLDSMVSLAWNEIRHRARLVKRYARVPAVEGDESRLGQVFLNLIVNAAQAIDLGEVKEGSITLSTALEGDRVVVEVADTGAGIGQTDLPHVFEPFFTTKPAGKGTGLGLTICRTIVASHGGEIGVSSGQGKGSTFRVSLPLAKQGASTQTPVPEGNSTEPRRSRILVIDDEPLLGQTLMYAFSGRHDIELSTSGREALERLAQDSNFDLVLCDLMMPDVSGPKVFDAIARDYPTLVPRFAFMTGGAFTERAQDFLERYHGRRVDKPFTIGEIEQLLVEIGAQSGPS